MMRLRSWLISAWKAKVSASAAITRELAREKTQERSSEKQTGRMGLKIQKCACSSSINGDGFCASGRYQRARVVAEIRFLSMEMPVRSKKRLYREGRRR